MSMKNSSDIIGKRNHDLPACSAVLQQTASPRAVYLGLLINENPVDDLTHTVTLSDHLTIVTRCQNSQGQAVAFSVNK